MTHAGGLTTQRAERGLEIALEISGAEHGFMVLRDGGQVSSVEGKSPDPELVVWAEQHMAAEYAQEKTALLSMDDAPTEADVQFLRGIRWHLTTLKIREGLADVPLAALVLGFEHAVPAMPPQPVLAMIAQHLHHPSGQLDSAAWDSSQASTV